MMSESNTIFFSAPDHLAASPRVQYVLNFLSTFWDCKFVFRSLVDDSDDAWIMYGKSGPSDAFYVVDAGLLSEAGRRDFDRPTIELIDDCPVIFGCGGDLGFDIFSAIFYCLSRYEEYQWQSQNSNEIFSAKDSLWYGKAYHRRALVEEWVEYFKHRLIRKFPFLVLKSGNCDGFRVEASFDMDHHFAFQNRGIRSILGMGKDLISGDFDRFNLRMMVLLGRKKDPFDTIEELISNCRMAGITPYVFLLMAKEAGFPDNLVPRDHPAVLKNYKLLDRAGWHPGIHPSFASHESEEVLSEEMIFFKSIMGYKPNISRQHYLKIRWGETYRLLECHGIYEEHSMAFVDDVGFRAATGQRFLWYDLEEERATNLRIVPYMAMDVSLSKYLGLQPEEAIQVLQELMTYCEKSEIPFRFIWHNSSFSPVFGWLDWKKVFDFLIEYPKKINFT